MGGEYLIGVDLGGTKIEGVLFAPDGTVAARERIMSPRDDYKATLDAIGSLISRLEATCPVIAHKALPIGIGVPGSISPATGLMQNANSIWLNGKPFDVDLERHLARPVKLANDANCFALSEAVDGAGAGYSNVFGVIIGTGCGGGLVVNGNVVNGPRGIGGEWGHNPLPWLTAEEFPGPQCWCGRPGCMEVWISGPALSSDHERATGTQRSAEQIVELAAAGDHTARASLGRHASRLARGLAHVVNMFDPDVIVLGGGLSKLTHLYEQVPPLMAQYIFADSRHVTLKPPKWGDASGVRGAAWLWR